ncbi:putative aquaporin TIP5-1, partial [Drosera capensis]
MSSTSFTARIHEAITPNSLRAYLAEFISTFVFALAVAGSSMSSRKLMPDVNSDPSSLVAVAIAGAFGLASAVYISVNISGGHVNPAVTFAKVVSGHMPFVTAIFYWTSQILGAIMGCLLLKITTVEHNVTTPAIAQEMTGFGASILEGFLTFGLVYTVFAASGDPRQGHMASTGPLMIGLMAGANILASGPFSGGCMNPAYAFGSAAIAGSFKNQAVYWLGPLFGAAIAGLLYGNVVFPVQDSDCRTRDTQDGFR